VFADCRDVSSIVKWQGCELACQVNCARTQVNCATMQGHWLAAYLTLPPIAMTSNVQISRRLVVQNVNLKQPWLPETLSVDGMDFICCQKWDRTLARFATGQAIDMRKAKRNHVLNVNFIEEFARKRTLACDKAVGVAFSSSDEKGKQRRRKARSGDKHMVAPFVALHMPAMTRGDVELEPLVMNVLFGVKNEPVWLEATVANLEYLRIGILNSFDKEELGRHWKKTRPAITGGVDQDDVDTQATLTAADDVENDGDEQDVCEEEDSA
jgi:hypothetical protein